VPTTNKKTQGIQNIPHSIKLAILIIIATKILVFTIGIVVTYLNTGLSSPFTAVIDMFNRWDAPHYVDIARNWYVSDPSLDAYNFIVFFPLYPILIRLITLDLNYINLSALMVSNVCSLIAFSYLYKLAKLEFNENVAVKAVLFLSVFPTAYFLSSPYTEGLFFALVIASVYYARLGNWSFAGSLSLFAALTKLFGLLLFPVLFVEYLHQRGWKPKKLKPNVLWTFSALAGFLIYLGINYQVTGSPFTFMAIQALHWGTRLDPLSGLEGAYGWTMNAFYPDKITVGIAPIAFAVFGLLMVVVSIWKRQRPVYMIYMFLSWALAVSTSWWISVPRYVMTMFPIFSLLGSLMRGKRGTIAGVIVSGALLCFFTAVFARGWWAF
jgi:hypothetical protein